MRAMRAWAWVLLAGAIAGCDGSGAIGCHASAPVPAAGDDPPAAVAHGDHSPHHGGIVMMKGDLHYEVVLDPSGRYRLYFSDATREDLPAAAAANASITITRPDAPPEGIALRIDDSGESWIGEGNPVAQPSKTTSRVSFTVKGEEPYWIDLPFDAKADAAQAHGPPR
jgi:hypothetical protein